MSTTVTEQHSLIGNQESEQFSVTTHPDAQWFLQGGNFGMFIHFGLSAVNGNVDLSWGMLKNKTWETDYYTETITASEYFSLAKEFNPVNLDFDKIIKMAKDSGHTYAVFTTRHHDGFCMWPSQYSDFGTKTYLNGVDYVKQFVDACNKYQIKAGLYYSPPDWHRSQEYMSFSYTEDEILDVNHRKLDSLPKPPEDWEQQTADYVRNQITELLKNYGKIDLIWFDGSIPLYDKTISVEEIRALQNGIIICPRLHKKGDFQPFEREVPKIKPKGLWEYCDVWPEHGFWGYSKQVMPLIRTAEWAKDRLDNVTSRGGNFLLNVAPDALGDLPPIMYQRYAELKQLMGI